MRSDEIGLRQGFWFTLGLWLFTYLIFLMPSFADGDGIAWQGFPIIAAAVSVGLVLSLPLFLLMRAIRDWPLWLRIVDAGFAAAAMAWLHSLLDAAIVDALRDLLIAPTPHVFDLGRVVDKFLTYVWIYELYVTAIGLIMSTGRAIDRERDLIATRAAADQAQLAALRFQLNPHFLFNTLNAISSLVVTRRGDEAEEMIARLSEFLRASLAADPQGQVMLDDELETLHAYLDIEGVRFGDRLRFEVRCPVALNDVLVPSFILQPLVENAVKYAVSPSRRGATISVEATREGGRLRLTVRDDGDAAKNDGASGEEQVSTGVGLKNVRQRLHVLYGTEADFTAGHDGRGFVVVLRFPLRHAERNERLMSNGSRQ